MKVGAVSIDEFREGCSCVVNRCVDQSVCDMVLSINSVSDFVNMGFYLQKVLLDSQKISSMLINLPACFSLLQQILVDASA